MTTEAKTFREAYAVLQGHAETLRQQTEPNIDDLLAIVVESVDAYKVCKDRIDAVEKALQQALTGVATESGPRPQSEEGGSARSAPVGPQKAGEKSGFDDMDDDVPF